MAGTISFSGLSASGLDTSSWVDALVSVKQQTITSLEQQKAEKENLLSIVNNIKSYFSSFQTCLQKITDSQYGIASMDLFMQNLALSSNSSIATATATTEAARQSYDVAVDSLATATKATSGYSQIEVKTADLNTTFGTLGGKNGTITVNSQSFNVTTEDTLQNLIDKFKNVGVDAKFDENKGTFTIGMDLDKIDEGATNLKNALRLANNNVSGAVSGSVVYANRNTEFYKLGLNGGDINIEGVKHTITKNGNDYTIQKDGGTAVQMNTLGEFLDYLKSSAVGADDATVDAKGHITIKGATLDKVEGGTNLIDVLNLIESQKRTVSESGALSYIEVRVADLNTKLSALGITGDTTLVAGGTNNTISNDKTLGDIKNILKNAGVDMSVDSRGIITIDTHGNEISGTLLDVLNLDPTKGGTTISSSAHQATLKADGNTKLSELGISSDKKYTAYKSDGTALTTEISNVEGQTVDEFVNALKNVGLDAKFDEKTHQITIKDGYIEGSLADALGMTQLSTSFTENASLNTQLEKLGATGDSTLTIDGGTAKTYGKDTTLETVFNDIKNAGGKVTFKDGNVTIEGVTLGGSLPSLLGLDATTQGTSVTSGKLTAVTGSTSSGGNTESTVEHNIELSTKLGDITGTTSNYTLKVGDGASTTYTKDSTLQDIKTQIETAGGKFTINDDNTISIEGVTMSGTVVGALGFDELATGTKFTTVDAVMISGTSNVATGDTTLGNLGLVVSGSTSGARAVRRAPANPNKTLSINGGTAKTYGADASLDDIFADIVAAGGTASINSEGYIVIDGVHLEGTLVDALGLVETSYKTTITSGDLKVTTSTKSTSSSALYTDTKGDIAWDSTIGSIVGDTNSYDLKVNGTNKTYNTNTKLSDIKNVIQAAGGTMTINDDNTISINGVEISGSLVDKLGFNSDGVHTVVSSNNPIYYSDGKKSADTGTTFEQLGISSSKRDYAIYKNDGTEVKASSTDGTNSGKTIGDWLRVVNDSLNTANGTSDITYASINNGVISITGGYVTGSLPTELGIGTKETVTGITMEGSSVSYVEYDPLKYIGNTQTGSGIAAGTMVTSGFMTEAMQYKDELGNIHAVTETTKLSEVLDSGITVTSRSYTLNVGNYTKTFDIGSTTLGDIVNYVNNLNMDTTHDTTTSATLVDGKLTIESNVSITGTLLDKLGFEKQDVSSVAYEIKGTQKAHYKKNDGVTVTATTSTTIKELMGKGGEQAFDFVGFRGATPFSSTIKFAETDTIQTVIDKLKEFGFDEVDLVDGIFRIKDDKKWAFDGRSELVNKLFGGDDRTYGAEGPQVTYQVTQSSVGSYTGNKITYTTTTTGSAGSVTGNKLTYTTTTTTTTSGKTYSGDVVKTIAKGYSTGTKLVDINSDYKGKKCIINFPKDGSTSGSTGTGLNSGSGNELGGSSNNTITKPSGSVGTIVGGSTGSNNILLQQATLTINENTTIQDVLSFYSSNNNSAIYDKTTGDISINYKDGYSGTNPFNGGNIGQIASQTATTSTTLGELTSNLVLGKINVFNNGSEYSLTVTSSKTIQDVLDFFNNTAGCTATFTDGKLTVTGASDLEFRKAASGRTYDMSTLFGGNMPTGTTSTTTATITHTATGSTKMSELGITDFTVKGSALSGITSNSTINDVLAKLKSTYGLSEATISDGKITLKSNSSTTLSGNLIKGLMDQDFVTIIPTVGTTTIHTATGSTKMSELGITDFTVNGSALSGITSNSTINDVLAKLKSTYGLSEATISDGKVTLKSNGNTTLSGNLINRLTGQDSVTISPDTSTTTQTADTTTKLGTSGLGLTSFDLTIEPLGDATSISISGLNGDSTIGDVFKKLAEKGITASMNNGVITLTSNTEYSLSGTIAKKLFGNDSVDLECKDEIHNFDMTQVSGTKYQYVSRDLTANSGPERVSEVSQLVAGNKYHISSAEDLVALANFAKNGADTTGSIFMFDNDIDMSGVTGFTAIGTWENAFKGTVYGNGHVVKNMTINTSSSHQGLFGYINQSTIKDIGVVDANVTGGDYTGILVGQAENSQISNVYTSGTVVIADGGVGGLVGYLKNSTATNVYSTADVKGYAVAGGLIGGSDGSIVEKAFATGKVTATKGQVGGLIGVMFNGGTVKNSYATGDVNGEIAIGGFVGVISGGSITTTFDTVYSTSRVSGSETVGGFIGFVDTDVTTNIKNAVYNRSTGVDAIGGGSATGILGKDYEQMIQKSVMQNAGFTEDKGWVYSANSTPIFGNTTVTGGGKTYLDSSITSLTSGSTYYISTLEQLNNLATLVNNGADTSGVNFVLDNDIDVSSFTHIIMDFEGTFYGNGHSLTGLKTALFSTVGGNAIVRDLALENMSESGILANNVTDNSTVDNVYSTGSTNQCAGLIDTLNGNATLKNSYSTANVTTTSGFVGGLVGVMYDNATIENCFAKNTVEQTCAMSMNNHAGGLVGRASGGTIKSSYADCNINVVKYSSVNTTAGGLIGGVSGNVTIENCYATGSRTADKTGMFIGQNDGNVTSSGNVACTGSSISGTPFGFSDGVTFVSNAELNSQARMEALGFTKDKGWVYYTGKAPMLQGKDTSSVGTEHQIDTKSTLDSICKNRENKTLTVTINGETHSKTFKGSDTVGDVANWLNGIDGVTANVSNSKFNVSGASQDFRVDGELADVLFGNNKTITNQTITENTDSNGLMVDGGQKKIDNNTTVGQLLGVTSGKYAITYIDDSGNLQSEKFSSDEKLSEVLKYLNNNGFQASIVNGVFTATKDGKIATNISGAIGEKLKGENGTVTNTSSGYKTGQLDASSSTKATATTKLSDLGIASGSIFIKDNNNNTLGTIQIDNSMTIDDTAQLLANYGFTLGITDGKVTIEGNGTNRIADGTSNLVSQMKLNNWIETKDKLKTDSTVAQMGFGKGSTLGLVLDNKTYNLTFDANATLQDIIDTLGTYGVTASVDNNGKFTASASGNLVLTNELGAYLTKNSAEGYVKEADGYKSKDPLEFKGDKVKLDYDSKVGDILGNGKDGVLRLTLNKDTVVDLTYKADDTMADIIADLKGYGITATIDDGVLNATSNDKTFRLSGEIGKIISGDTPQYDDISTGYVSKDLSYETTNKTNMNNTLKEMGVSSGQIHVLSNDGKIVSTLDIDNLYTVAQVKSLLQPFGMTLSVDENGKFTVASAEGYKLSDSTSNMVSKMGLNNWTTATEKLSGATTLAQMGFKDGADLNLFLDGAVMNILSFDANQTVDDIIFGLAAYGIDASVNADGQFTATSKSHTFIMSGGLGSYLTKGTGGYVNSDTAYESYKPLVESKDYVETASKGLDYKDIMTEGSTLESLGFAQGGTVRVMLDGKTPYTLQFLATDKVQDVIYALSAYGINAEVKDGRFVAESVNNTFTLTGNLGSYFVEGGAYQNEVTGYESKPLTYETTEKLTNDTKLSDLGITRGDINVIKDGKVADTIHISDDTTIGQLFSAIKPYGMTGEIVTKANGDTSIRISADSDIKLADGTSNVVSGLGLQNVRKGDFEGMKKYWDDDATSGLITEDTLLSTLDRNGFIAQGSLIFNTGEGDDAVQHIINISANETVGSLLKKFNDSGIKATLDDGVIKLTGGLDKLTFTGGTSGLVETIGLDIHNIDKYASSTSALTYEGETHYSASNFANASTKLDIVNATDGNMSIFVDGVKCNIEVKSSDSFADLFKKIKDTVKARTGLDIQAGFKTKDGSISANPTDANNTGIIGLEIEKGHELVVGASNDTTNFATIANLNKTDYNVVTGSRALYRVNVNSLITESGLYRDGDITEGTFKIGDAEFTIDSTTTLASLINQINKNDKAYASAYWDTLAGTLVIESTVTGASLINIEAGTSNFTDIMGFTKTKDGVSALVTDSQTLGQNAVVRINGTTVTSATNVITSDISKIKGLTINLKNVSAGETVTISVEQDKEAIYNAVSDTLDAYNSMMEALGKELADKKSLGGESILKLMRNNLKRLMTSSLTGAYVFKNLASVGISTGEASDKITTNVTSLLIDKDKFMDALNTDSDAVQDLLVGTKANPGIFLQANNIVENSINTDGYFSNMANTLTKSINNIEKKISKNNLAIENYRTKLETKFHNMELTISGLQSAYANILK